MGDGVPRKVSKSRAAQNSSKQSSEVLSSNMMEHLRCVAACCEAVTRKPSPCAAGGRGEGAGRMRGGVPPCRAYLWPLAPARVAKSGVA